MEIGSAIIVYLLKSGVAFTALYLLYCAVFRTLQNFTINRFFLIFCAIFSLVFPFIRFTRYVHVDRPSIVNDGGVTDQMAASVVNGVSQLSFTYIIIGVYIIVVAFLLLRLLFILTDFLLRLHQCSSYTFINGRKVLVANCWEQTFSFFNIIVLSKSDFSKSSCNVLFRHELAHVQQFHSVDILLAELFQIIQWFNPLAYRLKNDMCEVHEFLADSYVVRCGVNCVDYQKTLLNYVESSIMPNVANMFSAKLLKKRFAMMTLDNSPKKTYKYLLTIPLVVMLVLVMSFNTQEVSTTATTDEHFDELVVADYSNMPVDTFVVVEQMPKFNGGELNDFLITYLNPSVVYPAEAVKNGIQGSVNVNFVVDTEGNVTNVKVAKNVNPLLDAEAVRVVSSSPRWTPGKQRGKNVSVQFTIPINFKLDNRE